MGSDIKKFRPWKTKVVVVFLLYLVTVHVIILGSTQRKNKILRFCGLLPTGPNILPNRLVRWSLSSWIQKEMVVT